MGIRFFGKGQPRPGSADPTRGAACPRCRHVWEGHGTPPSGLVGRPGQFSVCCACGALLVCLRRGGHRIATPAEQFRAVLGPYGEVWHSVRLAAKRARIRRIYGVDLAPTEVR